MARARIYENGEDTIKDFGLNLAMGAPEQALRSRLPFSGSSSEIDPDFISRFGGPADDRLLMLPLVLKEKVAALVYADAGADAGGKMDAAALELLVRVTSAWLEVASLRKQAQKEESADTATDKSRECSSIPASGEPCSGAIGSFCFPCTKARGASACCHSARCNRATRRRGPGRACHLSIRFHFQSRFQCPVCSRNFPGGGLLRLRQRTHSPICRLRMPTSIAKRSALPGCWWMRSSCITRRR